MRLTIEPQLCTGCRLCQQICAITHFNELNPRKSAIRIQAKFPVPGRFVPSLCDQCGDCAAACPAEAITAEQGVFVIDPEQCSGCGLCLEACATAAIHIPAGESTPIKCDLCRRCVDVCGTGALIADDPTTRREVRPCTVSAARSCV